MSSYLVDGSECYAVYKEEVGLLSGTIKTNGDEDAVILSRPARSGQEMHLRHVVILAVQNLVFLRVTDVLLDEGDPGVSEGAEAVGDAVPLTTVILIDGGEILIQCKL